MRPKSKSTIREVARLASVSISTVSAVINGKTVVSPERKTRVLNAMESLNFKPDQIAQSLRRGRSLVIGALVPDMLNLFFPHVLQGVEDVARESGYSVILCNSNEEPEQERHYLDLLASRRVDGILIACTDSTKSYDEVQRGGFPPVVFFDRVPHSWRGSMVCSDNIESASRATRHLIELGHERIAIVTGNLRLSIHTARLEGFRQAMQQADLPVHGEYCHENCRTIETGYGIAKQLISLPSPPTAIFSTSNRILLGIVRALSELRIQCPEQISLLGFDDFPWTRYFSPGLTVVAQPAHEIGRKAVERLLHEIEANQQSEPTAVEKRVVLTSELRVRSSTAAPGTARAMAQKSELAKM